MIEDNYRDINVELLEQKSIKKWMRRSQRNKKPEKMKPEKFETRKTIESREKTERRAWETSQKDKKEKLGKLSHLFRRQDLFHGTIRILGTCSSRENTFYENHQGNMFGIIGKLQNLPSFQYSHRTLHPDAVCP